MSDGDLVRQALAGRSCAYEELVQRWAPRIMAICHAKVGRSDAAEDLAQETLLRGYRFLSSLEQPEKFGSWLQGIAIRTCLDWLKAKQRTEVSFTVISANSHLNRTFEKGIEAEEAKESETAEDINELMAEVERLPEEYREVLFLFYYEDLKYRDIAAMLGVSTATVNARLTKARALLKQRMAGSRR